MFEDVQAFLSSHCANDIIWAFFIATNVEFSEYMCFIRQDF